jgi:hypothetical protein
MIDDRSRIVDPNGTTESLLFLRGHEVWLMNPVGWHSSKFRDITADVITVWIELLALERRVEDPIPWHGI